jgi:circadian clock protein KaiC
MIQPDADTANARVTTGIHGLDAILGGGLPAGHMYLVEGESGAGKTTLGLHFLLAGRQQGETCLWITMSETERELHAAARSHGWSLDGIHILNLLLTKEVLHADEQYSFFSPADVELSDTTKQILDKVKQLRPARVVFDPFSDIRYLARETLGYRRQILALRDFFSEQNCTVLLMQEMTRASPGDIQAEALTHGYLTLLQESPEYGGQRRRIRIHKMRGIAFRDGFHDFVIRSNGIRVYPRLVPAEHFTELPDEIISTGLPELDRLLGGGCERGSSLLILGPAGVGKSSLAAQCALAAAERGEKVLFFMFDETMRAFATRTRKLGLPFHAHVSSGLIRLQQVDSAQFSPGEFAQRVIDAIDGEAIQTIVVDSLSGYINAMTEERFLATHLHELLTYLTYKNVFTIMTLAQHGVLGENVMSPVDLSYLADTVMLIRYFEAFGAIRRAVSVVKKRSGPHETLIREMLIRDGRGIALGDPLSRFQGVLTGRPTFTGEEPMLDDTVKPQA